MSTTKVITNKLRFSYLHVFEAHAMKEGQEKKFSACLLIPKSDKKGVAKIQAGIDAALEAAKAKFGGKIPKNFKMPLRDGDEEKEGDENFAGHYFINANSNNKPGIIDEDKNEIMDRAEFYSGCYGRASINFYVFDVSTNKGIACGLNNLQKLEDGENLSGSGASAEEDFADDDLD